MKVTGRIEEVREEVKKAKAAGSVAGLVPTMGALHEAHLSLIRRCKKDGCFVVVTIYVNPAQFGPREDLDKYPRPLEKDLSLCEEEGVDLVFTPTTDDMYPDGHCTWVNVEGLTGGLCGAFRPGHFRGVTTIVTKLFTIVQPDVAYFGRKDYQQLKVIERMTVDLDLPVKIIGCPLVRDYDGIALSSRNSYLSDEERKRARTIPRILHESSSRWDRGVRVAGEIMAGLREELQLNVDTIEYFGIYHPQTLEEIAEDEKLAINPTIALAVYVGKTRLIDNIQLGVDRIEYPG